VKFVFASYACVAPGDKNILVADDKILRDLALLETWADTLHSRRSAGPQ
jgi:hypothetical protein